MMAHLRPIDKEFEEADDTGVLVLSSRNLRNFPVVPGELCDFNDLLEAGIPCTMPMKVYVYMYTQRDAVVLCSDCSIPYTSCLATEDGSNLVWELKVHMFYRGSYV